VTVLLIPAEETVSAGDTFTLDVEVDPSLYGITAGDVEIFFEPAVFEAIDIQPGDLMGTDVIMGSRKMDNTAGKVSIAVGRVGTIPASSVPTPAGTLATVQIKVKDGVSPRGVSIVITSIGLADQEFSAITSITKSFTRVTIVP
jgi:hypothetical protein